MSNRAIEKLFGSDEEYREFLNALEDVELPAMLEMLRPISMTMKDVKTFCDIFRADTGLTVRFMMYTCTDCGKLHMHMLIEDEEQKERPSTLLQ